MSESEDSASCIVAATRTIRTLPVQIPTPEVEAGGFQVAKAIKREHSPEPYLRSRSVDNNNKRNKSDSAGLETLDIPLVNHDLTSEQTVADDAKEKQSFTSLQPAVQPSLSEDHNQNIDYGHITPSPEPDSQDECDKLRLQAIVKSLTDKIEALQIREISLLAHMDTIADNLIKEREKASDDRKAHDLLSTIIEDCDISIFVHESRIERNTHIDITWDQETLKWLEAKKVKTLKQKTRVTERLDKRLARIAGLEEDERTISEEAKVVADDLMKALEERRVLP
ncbi:hypothetical protein FHETE_8485 [Fusarium heterosporum]|uniref:Uncharacterized protein n=1 Tax=Fusarium heterosporum TaxID=42747 RepID=A0A8H5T1K3_FUSHE|nr:hypothetical protein FHETE_8485 [Fusarium heterosporum]